MKKKLLISFNEIQVEQLDKIRQKGGYDNYAVLIKQAIFEMHNKLYKDYVEAKEAKARMTPEEIAERKSRENARAVEIAEERQIEICNQLGGEVDARKICRYNNYHYETAYPQGVPLDELTEELFDVQFSPDKKTVLKALKEKEEANG